MIESYQINNYVESATPETMDIPKEVMKALIKAPDGLLSAYIAIMPDVDPATKIVEVDHEQLAKWMGASLDIIPDVLEQLEERGFIRKVDNKKGATSTSQRPDENILDYGLRRGIELGYIVDPNDLPDTHPMVKRQIDYLERERQYLATHPKKPKAKSKNKGGGTK